MWGGIGKFASVIAENVEGCTIVVIDNSDLVNESFVDDDNAALVKSDWLEYKSESKFDFIIFKTVLHHFIKSSELKTRNAQVQGLLKAAELLKDDGILSVGENFYESAFRLGDLSGRLIYEITKLTLIEKIARKLGANKARDGSQKL